MLVEWEVGDRPVRAWRDQMIGAVLAGEEFDGTYERWWLWCQDTHR